MSTILTEICLDKIIRAEGYEQKILALIGILEGYLSKVSKKHFRYINSKSTDSVTLSELGILYKNFFSTNTGINGVCWEYVVFNDIYYNDTYIQDLINEAINYLTGQKTFERINAILWGGEKSYISLENIYDIIPDEETIWTPYKQYNFKDYLTNIQNAFRSPQQRAMLPSYIDGIWKADLFVKKEDSTSWHAVTVKWNCNEIKYYNGLSIGIYFQNPTVVRNLINPEPIRENGKCTAVYCAIPFAYNMGEYYTYMFRLVENLLSVINSDKRGTLPLKFATSEEYGIFEDLYENRNVPCIDIIDYFKRKYHDYTHTREVDETIITSGGIVTCSDFTYNNVLNHDVKEIKIIPR